MTRKLSGVFVRFSCAASTEKETVFQGIETLSQVLLEMFSICDLDSFIDAE
jgi:hypothetical protein